MKPDARPGHGRSEHGPSKLEPPELGPPTIRRAPHTAWRHIDDETIVVDLAGHRMLGLDAAGGAVWHRLDTPQPLDSLIAAGGGGRAATARFLAQLIALGVLEVDGELEQHGDEERGDESDAPRIVWQEEIAQVAASCGFLPGQNTLCNAIPFQ